jgi:hypothetical protein
MRCDTGVSIQSTGGELHLQGRRLDGPAGAAPGGYRLLWTVAAAGRALAGQRLAMVTEFGSDVLSMAAGLGQGLATLALRVSDGRRDVAVQGGEDRA